MAELNLDRFLKYYNIFSFLYLKYFRNKEKVRPMAVYKFTIKCAEKEGEFLSYWDVFDGTLWICTLVALWLSSGIIGGFI